MGNYSFTPRGVCARVINFDIEDGRLKNVSFIGGCNGNTQGISKLCEGMTAEEVVSRLKGINCGGRGTSCPDQLTHALELALEKENQ